jgi:hypothetical protein
MKISEMIKIFGKVIQIGCILVGIYLIITSGKNDALFNQGLLFIILGSLPE